ncbi:hypothetical protein HPB50_008332 [Hyalomma asiaticum]|uniref:Uncharacterized protein n=1 Tax=Hyalomma asiaticum TaxID=266040 RepID=A0ACB7SUJ5_HYAAI|nr:hypothetical protein HPB50_008332 [Hyalomma asiaticum]
MTGSHREQPNYPSDCHRKALLQFFDDLQDSVHTRDDGDLANFIRHFCKAKYTEVPPCELDEGVKELEPVSSREFKHLYAALRQFVCEGELHTWQGKRILLCTRNACGEAFAALGNWSLPRAALCNEIERSTRSCSGYDNAETKVLTLAATAMKAFNCTVRAEEDVRYLQTDMSRTLHCLELLKLNDCLNPNGMLSAVAIFGVSHTSEQCRTIESKAVGCVDRALLSPDACGERPDIDGIHDFVHAFLASADCSREPRSDSIRPLPGPTLFVSGAVAATVALVWRL